jgi:hypothetical protein
MDLTKNKVTSNEMQSTIWGREIVYSHLTNELCSVEI